MSPTPAPPPPPSPAGTSDSLPLQVVKVGGSLISIRSFADTLCDQLCERHRAGERLVIVHGGGPQIEALHERVGIPSRKRGGLRTTPPESIELVAMALRASANLSLVRRLVFRGLPALGLSGVDLGLLRSEFQDRASLGFVGASPTVDAGRLRGLVDAGYLPVIAPLCLGPAGEVLNVNADTVAQAVSSALQADRLDFVSDVPGVYDDSGVRWQIRVPEVNALLRQDAVKGGMIPKLQAALGALQAGVPKVRIGSLSTLRSDAATVLCP